MMLGLLIYSYPSCPETKTPPTADPNGDNLQNLIEYAIGTPPNAIQQDAITRAISSQLLSLTFDRLPARADLTASASPGKPPPTPSDTVLPMSTLERHHVFPWSLFSGENRSIFPSTASFGLDQ